jgi:hypothetical protein
LFLWETAAAGRVDGCEQTNRHEKMPQSRLLIEPPRKNDPIPDSFSPEIDVTADISVGGIAPHFILSFVSVARIDFWLVPSYKTNTSTIMILQGLAIAVFLVWYFLLRPRRGGPNGPPMVSSNNRLPIIGVLVEFFKSPNTMVQRCYQDYGGVFTIPVRTTPFCVVLIICFHLCVCVCVVGTT